ncbi:MAG: GNAT family N-acetyltransferase [Acidimicrobiaceae bacterium]|nr:GNAT family N-acetyltransferase [Acidimicrobiaceae bacterium]MBO0747106.1 GNAT family N-acetyltransferase [Acidimicrobiaceae bacterium]
MPSLRTARPDDYPLLAAMRYEFRAAMDEPDEARDVFEARMVEWLEGHLGVQPGAAWTAWLAFEDTEVIGMVFLHVVDKVPNPVPEPERLGYITSMYVRPAHRGAGVGATLLDAALDECRGRGLDTIVLWPSARSRSLYERRGFQAPGLVMELPLVEHPGRSRL